MEEQQPSTKEESTERKNGDNASVAPRIVRASGKKKSARSRPAKTKKSRTRLARPYPASSFTEALPFAEAIHKYAAGQKVRRLTLLQQMQKSPTSSVTKMLITNSGKYGVTTGSYAAEWLELTQAGAVASAP